MLNNYISRSEETMASEILAAVKQPYSNFNHLPPSSEALEHRVYSPEEELLITELIPLANTIATDPEIASAFGIMKWEEMGDSDRSRRFSGKTPSTRTQNQRRRICLLRPSRGRNTTLKR